MYLLNFADIICIFLYYLYILIHVHSVHSMAPFQHRRPCEMTSWTEWSECSHRCGLGSPSYNGKKDVIPNLERPPLRCFVSGWEAGKEIKHVERTLNISEQQVQGFLTWICWFFSQTEIARIARIPCELPTPRFSPERARWQKVTVVSLNPELTLKKWLVNPCICI